MLKLFPSPSTVLALFPSISKSLMWTCFYHWILLGNPLLDQLHADWTCLEIAALEHTSETLFRTALYYNSYYPFIGLPSWLDCEFPEGKVQP